MRQSGLFTEKGKLEKIMDYQESFQKRFQRDVWDVVKNIENYKKLKKSLVKLYKKYVLNEEKNEESSDAN